MVLYKKMKGSVWGQNPSGFGGGFLGKRRGKNLTSSKKGPA